MSSAIHTDAFLPHPPEKVWRALTDPELTPEGTGTRLFLDHEGFDAENPGQQATLRILGGGWRGHLARRLEETLSTTGWDL